MNTTYSPSFSRFPQRNYQALIITICGLFFGMANPFLHIPVLIFLFPIGILQIVKTSSSATRAFRQTWVASSLGYGLSLYWVAIPIHDFAYILPQTNVPWVLAVFCPFLLGTYLGLFPAFFALILFLAKIKNRNWILLGFFSGITWVNLELLRGILFTGFPWLDLPTAFAPWPVCLQHLRWWGVPGATFLIVTCAVWLATALQNRYPLPPLLASVLVLGIIVGEGHFRLQNNAPEENTEYTIRLVQGNIAQQKKWNPVEQKKTVDTYLLLSDQGIKQDSPLDLIIWPETALPLYLQDNSMLGQNIRAFAARKGSYMLIGSPAYREKEDGSFDLFNRAYLLSPFGETIGSYDKQHLVPFGEYIPFKDLFPFLKKLSAGAIDFSSGIDAGPLHTDRLALGIMICYEAIFSDTAQQRVKTGSNVLVNISNDAWFGNSSAPRQHLNATVLRCIEQNRFLLRATNTGISAIIDNTGTITARTELFKSAKLTETLPLRRENTTFYHRNYTSLRMAFPVIFVLLLYFLPKLKKRRQKYKLSA